MTKQKKRKRICLAFGGRLARPALAVKSQQHDTFAKKSGELNFVRAITRLTRQIDHAELNKYKITKNGGIPHEKIVSIVA